VLDPVLGHEPIGVEDGRDEHVSGELIQVKKVEEDHEELVECVLDLDRGVSE